MVICLIFQAEVAFLCYTCNVEIIALILFGLLIWQAVASFKQARYYNANVQIVAEYMNLLFMSLHEKKWTEDDLRTLVLKSYLIDYHDLSIDEFNNKWEALCKSFKFQPMYDYLSEGTKTVGIESAEQVVTMLYTNRKIFEKIWSKYPVLLKQPTLPKKVIEKFLKEIF